MIYEFAKGNSDKPAKTLGVPFGNFCSKKECNIVCIYFIFLVE